MAKWSKVELQSSYGDNPGPSHIYFYDSEFYTDGNKLADALELCSMYGVQERMFCVPSEVGPYLEEIFEIMRKRGYDKAKTELTSSEV